MRMLLALTAVAFAALSALDQSMPEAQRVRYRNPDGSCVWCSIGMTGVQAANANAASILWNSEYGPAERRGAWPERVAEAARKRGLPIYNVQGQATEPWLDWALATGRWAGVTYWQAHMVAAAGMSEDGRTIRICDNNSPWKFQDMPREVFYQRHRVHGGGWAVILQGPPPIPWIAPPQIAWWSQP